MSTSGEEKTFEHRRGTPKAKVWRWPWVLSHSAVEEATLIGAKGMRAVKGHEVKKGGWGQLKAFGLYSRGSEEPPKIVGKLDMAKDMFKNARRTRDQPHLGGSAGAVVSPSLRWKALT